MTSLCQEYRVDATDGDRCAYCSCFTAVADHENENLVDVALLLDSLFQVLVSVVSIWSFLSLFFVLVVSCVGSSTRVSIWSPIY